ncbi:MAG: PAS domain-containing protein [Alsobacter sp.]
MKHPATRTLFAYWNRLRGERTAPERSEIDPVEIRDVLADTFVCEVDAQNGHPFRLAGTRLCGLFGRELKGRSFASLWDPGRMPVGAREAARLVDAVLAESRGVVAGLRGTTRGLKVLDLELLILPLRHGGKTHSRLLGCLSPSQPAPWAGLDPVIQLDLASVRVIRNLDALAAGPDLAPETPPPPAPPPERRGLFTIYRGGRDGVDRVAGPSS